MEQGELRVFDVNRKPIGIIYPVKAVSLAWGMNQITPGTFALPMDALRWSDVYLRHMHRVEYHHPSLPQPWLGIITEPGAAWPDGQVSCVSAEWLYTKRFTDKFLATPEGTTGGDIVHLMHEQATRFAPLGVLCGDVDRSGPPYYQEFQLQRIWDALTALCEMTGGAVWVEKQGHEHRDPWLLRYSRTMGQDRTATTLLCAEIVDDPGAKSSAANIATAVHVLGAASGSGNGDVEDRLYLYLVNRPSRELYDLLEERIEFPDIIDPTLLNEAGLRKLYALSQPLRTFGLNVDNRADVWGKFWLADTVRALMTRVGFAGLDVPVRVTGIQYNSDSEKLGLTVEILQ